MTMRIRFDITWTVNPVTAPGAQDSCEHLADHLVDSTIGSFVHLQPERRTRVCRIDAARIDNRALFNVNLESAQGSWNTPEVLKTHIEKCLTVPFDGADPQIVVQAWRKADPREAVDHGAVYAQYGASAEQSNFPVFRPEPDAVWEEADEVFL